MRHLWILVAVAACSGSHHARPDAVGDVDAGVDGAPDAGSDGSGSDVLAPTDVRVLLRDGFTPIAGVRVVFAGTGGMPSELTTDATGAATATMAMGGNVTVIRDGQVPEIYDYVAVKPGEILHVGHVSDTATTSITVTVPGATQGTVRVVTACGTGQGTGPDITVPVATCPPKPAFYVADSAQEGFAAKVPYSATIDLSQQALADFLSTTLLTYNVTPDLASVTVEARAMDGTHSLYSTGIHRVDQTGLVGGNHGDRGAPLVHHCRRIPGRYL